MISVLDDDVDPLMNFVPMAVGEDVEPSAMATVPAVPDVVAYAGR